MNGHAPSFRAKPAAGYRTRPAHFNFRLIFNGTILILCLLTPARGQDLDEVSFSGVVTDQHGAVVPGARVTARLAGAKAERTTLTDGAGRYRLVELVPGVYALSAERAGFAAEQRRGVRTLAGQSVRLDFTLGPEGVAAEQTIVSDAPAPALDAARTVAGGTLTREELERLASHTLSPLDFVLLLGGVTKEPLGELYS